MRPVPSDVVSYLTAASRMADHRDVLEIERFEERLEVVGVRVHVVSARGLSRTSVPAAIMSNGSETVLRKEEHLRIPSVGIQRPTMGEGYDRPLAPILV